MTVNKKGSAHSGWRSQEDELLFERVEQGRRCGMPLKAVFFDVAKRTGRQPNSVRNYYYARVRAGDPVLSGAHCSAFVPFTQDEELRLLKTVLTKHAAGKSVRAIALELGNGDDKQMLRYQNKYRALIKSAPAQVREAPSPISREEGF